MKKNALIGLLLIVLALIGGDVLSPFGGREAAIILAVVCGVVAMKLLRKGPSNR